MVCSTSVQNKTWIELRSKQIVHGRHPAIAGIIFTWHVQGKGRTRATDVWLTGSLQKLSINQLYIKLTSWRTCIVYDMKIKSTSSACASGTRQSYLCTIGGRWVLPGSHYTRVHISNGNTSTMQVVFCARRNYGYRRAYRALELYEHNCVSP